MTRVVFFKSNGVYWGFEEQGHAGFAEEGKDVLCASISSITMFVINAIEEVYHSNIGYKIDEKTTTIRVSVSGALPSYESDEKKQYAVSELIKAYKNQIEDLAKQYPNYLNIKVIEKEYNGN